MKCSVALERVRSDIGEDIPQLWRDRELYYYLEKGQQKLCNDVQIEEEMTAQVTAENRVGLPQTVVQVVEVLYKKLATDTLAKMRQVPITELEYATEWSVWDNYLYFGDVLTTCADGLIIRCRYRRCGLRGVPREVCDGRGVLCCRASQEAHRGSERVFH
jgi:hypothetical protein